MKKSIYIVGILLLVLILNFVSSATCDDYQIPKGESLCIEQTCPGADQNKCYCSMLCGYTAIEAGNIQSNLQSKIGSSVGTASIVSNEAKDTDKKKKECNKSNKCYFEDECYSVGHIKNLTYCFEGEFIPQKSWGNLCEQDFECIEDFCYEERCYRGGRNNYLENKNKELENKLEDLENVINQKGNAAKINSITGAVVDNSLEKQSWIIRIWRKIFG